MLLAATAGVSPLGWAYLVCLLLGLTYGAMAGLFGLLGGHHDFHHGFDSPGHTPSEVQGMGHEPGAADSGIHMTPMNPVVIAIFLVSFGGTGLASMQLLGWGVASLALSAPSGFVMAAVTFAIFNKLFSMTQGSSGPSEQEVIGKEAEVITPIPENGLGEIAYTRRGSRFTAPARAESGAAVAKQSIVTVTRIVGHTYYIKTSRGPA
ncbi:MAG: NfeD family protein [Tepidisphaeraceae bacterium]|jgi:membrane protein implicated in regulation of membrane protease activity